MGSGERWPHCAVSRHALIDARRGHVASRSAEATNTSVDTGTGCECGEHTALAHAHSTTAPFLSDTASLSAHSPTLDAAYLTP